MDERKTKRAGRLTYPPRIDRLVIVAFGIPVPGAIPQVAFNNPGPDERLSYGKRGSEATPSFAASLGSPEIGQTLPHAADGTNGGARETIPGYHDGLREPGAGRLEMAHPAARSARPARKSVSTAAASIATSHGCMRWARLKETHARPAVHLVFGFGRTGWATAGRCSRLNSGNNTRAIAACRTLRGRTNVSGPIWRAICGAP